MSVESYAWPEMSLYAWNGTASAVAAYAKDVQLQVNRSITKFLNMTTGVGYTTRSQYVETNKDVSLSIGALYAGATFYALMASGANVSAVINMLSPADGASSRFMLWSAQVPEFSLQGSEGAIFEQKIKIIAPDCSGI